MRGKIYLVCPNQRRHKLVHLHQGNILAQTHMIPRAEIEHGSLHPARRLRISEPALRAVGIAVFSERAFITLHDPGVTSHERTARDEVPADSGSRRWYDAFGHHPQSRVHAEPFLNASVEIGQLARFGERDLEVRWARG